MLEIVNEFTGNNLKVKRESLLVTQDELAKELGVTKTTISLWEHGKMQPSKKHLRVLRKFFRTHKEME